MIYLSLCIRSEPLSKLGLLQPNFDVPSCHFNESDLCAFTAFGWFILVRRLKDQKKFCDRKFGAAMSRYPYTLSFPLRFDTSTSSC